MSKIQLPPKKNSEISKDEKLLPKVSEKEIQLIINKGGSPTQINNEIKDKIKNFNLLILESDLNLISEFCNKRPKKPGRIIGFSKKDWLLEAVQEKIEREQKKYKL
ncbi:MAG: hypothetical protein EOP42_02045 [Sphingobacteriaceae bacterium]|nr:MAG: hypothetical protein EOP42_02045 [Sphingobacteriaceae bacterium]